MDDGALGQIVPAAGDTTLDAQRAAAYRALADLPGVEFQLVHTDDVAWNHACFDWGTLLVENILQPLHRGEPEDFRPDRLGVIVIPMKWRGHDAYVHALAFSPDGSRIVFMSGAVGRASSVEVTGRLLGGCAERAGGRS